MEHRGIGQKPMELKCGTWGGVQENKPECLRRQNKERRKRIEENRGELFQFPPHNGSESL
jgi:hypothetical protein